MQQRSQEINFSHSDDGLFSLIKKRQASVIALILIELVLPYKVL